ncbi:MAG: uncharacterized protein QOH93_3188 [Chloroflexia bacterium]|jgi:putative PIN family toxin of toxin-antitoxin system|nr:uncharacterized protein [Chloroflexia bacterium]
MIRALLDTNIYISYLLDPYATGTIVQIVDAAIAGLYVPLLPGELLQEMSEAIERKKSLSLRIKLEDVQRLASLMRRSGGTLAPIGEQIPDITRDIKDDYLLAYAAIEQADYLVTGDLDLLVLQQVGRVKIITPADFLAVLKQLPSP